MLKTLATFFALLTSTIQAIPEGAGIQLFNPTHTHTLLVQGMRSGRWGWTKGHREAYDDSWLDTAIREVKEEAGFIHGIHYYICNSLPHQWGKRLYWQGITYLPFPKPFHNKSEHRNIGWISLTDLANYEITKDVEEWYVYSREVECDFS